MKHFILFVLLISLLSSCTNSSAVKNPDYNEKDVRIFYDSKKRPHKVVVFNGAEKCAMVDLDANTYQ